MLNITPPNCISRAPRSITKDFAHWKASEFRSFLSFYSIPCLWNILPDECFQHFILFVEAIWLLDQSSISPQCLQKSGYLLHHFCLRIEALYGCRYETFNVHSLLHLQDCVNNVGPLWACSCFWFEDYNGDLRKLFHGAQKVELQIAFSVCIQQKIPELIPLLPCGSSSKEFLWEHDMWTPLIKVQTWGSISQFICTWCDVSCCVECNLNKFHWKQISQISNVLIFKRIQVNQDVIHSKLYLNISRRNSYTVYVTDAEFVEVKFYVKLYIKCPNSLFCSNACTCKVPHYYGIADSCFKPATDIIMSSDQFTDCKPCHIIPVRRVKCDCDNVLFPITSVEALCVLVNCSHSQCMFVCKLLNFHEK